MEAIWRLSAAEALVGLRAGAFTSEDLVAACLERIGAIDSAMHAFITVAADKAFDAARASDRRRRQAVRPRPLEGLPFAIKDLTSTQGLRTTFGSALYADHEPSADEICVARLKAAGGILIGKTNTPEFGFGPRSINVFRGPTANPYDQKLTSGGSSGGSAAAVATGMVPLAHGTDFGGSVRTPASFCGVVGLRPTPGVIPNAGKHLAWNTLSTDGVLARNVDDAALMASVLSGRDDRDPTSSFHPLPATIDRDIRPSDIRVAFSPDLGLAPIAADVRQLFADSVDAVKTVCRADPAAPDCTEAPAAFATLRAAMLHRQFSGLVRRERTRLTAPFVWNVEQGAAVPADAFLAAEEARSRVYRRFIDFFRDWDFLLTPSAAVLPFPNSTEEVLEIDGSSLATPIDYLTITFVISLVGLPCISIPAVWTAAGLPFGLQIVAPPFQEVRLLAFAAFLERQLGFMHRWNSSDGKTTSVAR